MYPKVLVISNNALNLENSNGRTLGLLLSELPKDYLLQFCLNEESISEELVIDSYCISDKMIIRGILRRNIQAHKLKVYKSEKFENRSRSRSINKTPFMCITRELLWHYNIKKTDFFSMAQEFKPDIVLLLLGDAAFNVQLAYDISRKNKSKLVVFTTEDYYFKQWNYLHYGKHNLFFNAFMRHYRKTLDEIFPKLDLCIANTPVLANKYKTRFSVKTQVLMAAASCFNLRENDEERNTILYAGNLSLNRYKSIMEVAQLAKTIDPNLLIEIYGAPTPYIEQELKKESNIRLKGFVPYAELLPEMQKVRLLIHCESFDEFYQKDLQSAFSTKIADSLASGTPLLLFAPAHFSETKYLVENQAAFVCDNKEQLTSRFCEALQDNDKRSIIVQNALKIAHENHNEQKNRKRMLQYLVDLLLESK